jgi:hypothetical protein
MKTEKSHPHKNRREFGGCVELMPAPRQLIEFIDARRIWGFPKGQLAGFWCEEVRSRRTKSTLPPDRLVLIYPLALVELHGWRLELLIEPLVSGRIARIHAEPHLGALVLGEAWVSEIRITPFVHSDQLKPEATT